MKPSESASLVRIEKKYIYNYINLLIPIDIKKVSFIGNYSSNIFPKPHMSPLLI